MRPTQAKARPVTPRPPGRPRYLDHGPSLLLRGLAPGEYLNADAAAAYVRGLGLDVTASTVRAARRAGDLVAASWHRDPSGQPRSYGFALADLRAWVASRRRTSAP